MSEKINSDKLYEPADILVYVQGKGLILKEKSLVAYDRTDGKIMAVGNEAERFIGDPTGNILVYSPLRQGLVADYMLAVKLFAELLHRALGKRPLIRPAVMICESVGSSSVEKRALEDSVRQAGAGEVVVTEHPVEACIDQMAKKASKRHGNIQVMIAITKDDPEGYIKERLSATLGYAAQVGIPARRVAELLASLD